MADEKRVVRTAAVYGNFVLPTLGVAEDGSEEDLVITPDGIEITFDQWKGVRDAAVANHVVVRLDEDFPAELYAAEIEKRDAERTAAGAENKQAVEPTPAVDGTDANAGTGRRARNGG